MFCIYCTNRIVWIFQIFCAICTNKCVEKCKFLVIITNKSTLNREQHSLSPTLHTFPKSTNITSDRQNGKTHTKVQRITAKSNNRKKRKRTKDFPSLVSYRQKSQKRKCSDDQPEKIFETSSSNMLLDTYRQKKPNDTYQRRNSKAILIADIL